MFPRPASVRWSSSAALIGARRVAIRDAALVVERDDRALVTRLIVDVEASRHPEMDEQRTARREADDEVLAPPIDDGYPLALQLGGNVHRVVRPRQPCVVDPDAPQRPPGQDGLER